jgi:hypothetical protein
MAEASKNAEIERAERCVRLMKIIEYSAWGIGFVLDAIGPFNPRAFALLEVAGNIAFVAALTLVILIERREKKISWLREQREEEKDRAHASETKALRDELKAIQSPWNLSTRDAQKFVNALNSSRVILNTLGKVRICYLAGDDTGSHFAAQIWFAFLDAGWVEHMIDKTVGPTSDGADYGNSPFGVLILFGKDAMTAQNAPLRDQVFAIIEAFAQIGVRCEMVEIEGIPFGHTIVRIGLPPIVGVHK